MAQEPINIFARILDPKAVASLLCDRGYQVKFDSSVDEWREAIVTFGKGKKKQILTITHDPGYYSEPSWSQQMSGMRGYFSRFPDSPRKARALTLPSSFRFALSTQFDPDFDAEGDPRLALIFEIAGHLDGVLFTPSGFRDAKGRILFGAGGEDKEDPDALWPRVLGEVSMSTPIGAAMHESSRPRVEGETPDEAANPPSAERVARRALALVAVTGRAILEQDDPNADFVKETYADMLQWVSDIGIDAEFEEEERQTVHRPLGRLAPREQINSTWRLESLVILAWALKRFEIPPYDDVVKFNEMWKSLGLLNVDVARKLLDEPELRTIEEIRVLRNRLLAVHWRLRNFRVSPKVMDFAEFARTCWFGPLDLTGLQLVEGDLAIQGERIDRADTAVVGSTESIATERHQAVNWLWEGPEMYSEASVAT